MRAGPWNRPASVDKQHVRSLLPPIDGPQLDGYCSGVLGIKPQGDAHGEKTVMGDVKEAVKSLAGAALGAAAAGAAGVVAETMKQMSEGDKKGGDTGPGMMEKVAARSVAKPTHTSSKKRPASKKKRRAAKKKVTAVRAAKKKRSVKRRKKR